MASMPRISLQHLHKHNSKLLKLQNKLQLQETLKLQANIKQQQQKLAW